MMHRLTKQFSGRGASYLYNATVVVEINEPAYLRYDRQF